MFFVVLDVGSDVSAANWVLLILLLLLQNYFILKESW
jgi:hypothetical protein